MFHKKETLFFNILSAQIHLYMNGKVKLGKILPPDWPFLRGLVGGGGEVSNWERRKTC